MEISEREYEELKQQIKILEEKINGVGKPKTTLADLVKEHPIAFVRNSVENYPDFYYSKHPDSDVWKYFLQIGKMVHAESWKFYMGTAGCKPYIRSIGNHEYPKKISEMTEEQIAISVQMLNELIPIYNKYFKQTHQSVLYCDNTEGMFRRIYVEKIEE